MHRRRCGLRDGCKLSLARPRVLHVDAETKQPVTPDGRYLVVRGRLWRRADPDLPAEERARLVAELMAARRDKGTAMKAGDAEGRESARRRVDAAKVALGERGPVWWTDGAPDLNRRMARNTPYADWFTAAEQAQRIEHDGFATSRRRPCAITS